MQSITAGPQRDVAPIEAAGKETGRKCDMNLGEGQRPIPMEEISGRGPSFRVEFSGGGPGVNGDPASDSRRRGLLKGIGAKFNVDFEQEDAGTLDRLAAAALQSTTLGFRRDEAPLAARQP